MLDNFSFKPSLKDTKDPPPFKLFNHGSKSSFFLTCDHASSAIPAHMSGLGLSDLELSRHIAFDIGASNVTCIIAKILNAPGYLSGYSRLLIDCNRPLTSPTSIPTVSDGTTIPGNSGISKTEASARADAFFWPYHNQISKDLDTLINTKNVPFFVAIHSFTPQLVNKTRRPWHIGLLWEHDDRAILPLKSSLTDLIPGICIGLNEPYAIVGPSDFSIPEHGQKRGLPHVEIEIRQDLIDSPKGAEFWADKIAEALIITGQIF